LQQEAPERESLLLHRNKLAATSGTSWLRSLLHCSRKLRSVRACYYNAANSGACPAPELVALQQQPPELVRLRSLLRCSSNLRSLLATTQQAPKHESLLRCSSKLQSVRACCCNAANSGACPAPERESLLRCNSKLQSLSGSGACLLQRSKLRSFSAPERESLLLQRNKLAATSEASWLRSMRACCCNAANSGACPAPKPVALQQQPPELVRLRSLLTATQQASELFGSGA